MRTINYNSKAAFMHDCFAYIIFGYTMKTLPTRSLKLNFKGGSRSFYFPSCFILPMTQLSYPMKGLNVACRSMMKLTSLVFLELLHLSTSMMLHC